MFVQILIRFNIIVSATQCVTKTIYCFTFVDLKAQALQLRRETSCCYLLVLLPSIVSGSSRRREERLDSVTNTRQNELCYLHLEGFKMLNFKLILKIQINWQTRQFQKLKIFRNKKSLKIFSWHKKIRILKMVSKSLH